MTERIRTHITALIDRSGSMSTIRSDVVGGINTYVEEQDPKKCKITVILFDSQNPQQVVRDCKLKEWKPLTHDEYRPGLTTPLLDAMGRAIAGVELRDDTQEIFVVLTDGLENASVEMSNKALKALVQSRVDEHEWVFVYLGANQDAFAGAEAVGISGYNAENFVHDGGGTQSAYASAGGLTSNVRGARAGGQTVNVEHAYASTGSPKEAEEDHKERSKE